MMEINDITGKVSLYNGLKMPYLGLGVCQLKEGEEILNAVMWALETGYRLIDTASVYKNEKGVGNAIRKSGICRSDIFITSKVWNVDHGYYNTLNAFEKTIECLQVDYLDLYLIHWPGKYKFKETWKALECLYMKKKVKAIGVCNCLQYHLEYLLEDATICPMVNQMEFHPYLVQQSLLEFCKKKSVQFQGWGPLMKGKVIDIEQLKQLAEKYDKSIPQVVLRWQLQKDVLVIPRSSQKKHIISNADIFDFEIEENDIKYIDSLNQNYRTYKHPDEVVF